MIAVERTHDAELVRAILTDPDVWAGGSDDGSPDPDTFEPGFHDAIYYLVPLDDGEPMGVFLITPVNSTTFEWHTAILRVHRGRQAIAGCKLAIEWMRENSPALKLITWVEVEARHVYLYAKACGFGVEGVSHGSLMKGGRLRDQYLMGRLICQSSQQ